MTRIRIAVPWPPEISLRTTAGKEPIRKPPGRKGYEYKWRV
jgi:hypothetical protein